MKICLNSTKLNFKAKYKYHTKKEVLNYLEAAFQAQQQRHLVKNSLTSIAFHSEKSIGELKGDPACVELVQRLERDHSLATRALELLDSGVTF